MKNKKPKILVTGGAGYIGSFTVRVLKELGFIPIVFDNLETGHREAIGKTKLYVGDLRFDLKKLDKVFKKEKPEAVIHFAAYIEAGESVENPQKYFFNNVYGSLNLLKIMLENRVLKIVFSSSAAVYGNPQKIPVSENAPKLPTNPYGETKLMVEKILSWYHKAYGLSVITLRYFNAAGASLDGRFGQDYPSPTHLIIRACEAALGKRKDFKIFGNNYNTPDGTCIRDYIHVLDLAQAHVLALKSLTKEKVGFRAYNVGSGRGYSVLEVVEMVRRISGKNFPAPFGPRRPGDPVRLIASALKIKKELGFKPQYSDLATIVKTAWAWHKTYPNGFATATDRV